jgi:hypothetical protein
MAQKVLNRWGDKIGGFAISCQVSDKEWEGINQVTQLTDDIRVVRESYFYFSQLSPFVGVTIKKDVAMKLNGFNVSLHPIADFDFWYRMSTSSAMLFVKQPLAYYRISPNQSTNNLIDAMINNVYKYRLRLIEQGRYNNWLSRLALEASRINNIDFFKRTYQNVTIPDEFYKHRQYDRATKLLRIRLFSKLAWWYIRKLSFGNTDRL